MASRMGGEGRKHVVMSFSTKKEIGQHLNQCRISFTGSKEDRK
jgi:hypothetical protein